MLAVSACGSREPPARNSPAANSAGYSPSVPASPAAVRSLNAVAALSESDAWAVGTRDPLPKGIYPLTENWDGERWKVVPCPSPGGTGEPTRSYLAAVAIDAPDDAWAVGQWSPIKHVPPRYALIEHWNGAKWSLVAVPSSGGHATGLNAVAAISPKAAWALGEGAAGAVFMGWDGTRWRYLPSPAGTLLSGLAVISARDIWVVGSISSAESPAKYHALAEHWNGSKWTIVPTPHGIGGQVRNSALSAVSGSSSSNVWAVGWYQSGPLGIDHSTLVEHWDGARWQVQPSPDGPGSTADSQLFAVAALSRTSAWAIGSNEGPVPLIERWDGVHWTAMPSRLHSGVTDPALYQVAAVDPRYAWAFGNAVDQATLIEKWNGTRWQQVPNLNP